MKPVATARLHLRALTSGDAEAIHALDSDPEVMRFLDPQHVPTLAGAQRWIDGLNASYSEGSERGYWAAEEDGRFIGWFHLRPARDTGECELGYRLRQDAWGRGLATEGSRALIQLAGERVIARTMIENVRSRRVMEKCGMSPVRTFPYSGEGPDDEIEYAIGG